VNVCIALYKGKGAWHNAIVRRWTKSIYSHAELILPDNTAITIYPFDLEGIKRSEFSLPPEEEDEWDLFCLPVTPLQLTAIERFYKQTEGQGYDWIGMICSQILPFHIKREKRWYCSEWIAYALRLICAVDTLHMHCDMSPEVLFQLISEHKGPIKYSDRPRDNSWNKSEVSPFAAASTETLHDLSDLSNKDNKDQ